MDHIIADQTIQDLSTFSVPEEFAKGRPKLLWISWAILGETLVSSWIPGSTWRRILLKAYGAKIGKCVLIKPRVKIKFPWRLVVGDNSWIGESVWIDNMERVIIGSNVCISQGAYLCTGGHDYKNVNFPYRLGPIIIDDEVWICAMTRIGPSVHIGRGSVILFGSVLHDSTTFNSIYSGLPATHVGNRI